MKARKDLGFTLVELMTVVLIIAVLAAIAFPSYQNMMRRARRAEAVTIIKDTQLRLEKHRVDNASYLGAPTGNLQTQFYTVGVTNATATTYTITATRKQGPQQGDTACGDLSITFNAGNISRSPTASDCW